MKIEITPYIKELVRDYRECGCEVCAHRLARYITNKVQEAINYREEEVRESWWEQGEAVMKEMCDD